MDGDEGTYTCMMNTSLDMDSASAMLTVVGTPALRRHLEDSAGGVESGLNLTPPLLLSCRLPRVSLTSNLSLLVLVLLLPGSIRGHAYSAYCLR